MSRKTRKLIWSAPLVAVLAVAGALAIFMALAPNGVQADHVNIPGAPTGLTVEPASGNAGRTTLVLDWEASSGSELVTGYRIDYSDDNVTFAELVVDTGNTGTSYSDSDGLKPGGFRVYRVFALNSAGVGLVSNTASGVTKGAGEPDKVTGVVATAPEKRPDRWHEIHLSWAVPYDGGNDIVRYCIEVATLSDTENFPEDAAGCLANPAPTTSTVNAGTSYGRLVTEDDKTTYELDVGLEPSDTRLFRVYAVSSDGTITRTSEEPSDTVQGSTRAAEIPGTPMSLAASLNEGDDDINLYWNWPTYDGGYDITNFFIQVRNQNGRWQDVSLDADGARQGTTASHTLTANDIQTYEGQDAEAAEGLLQFSPATLPGAATDTLYFRVFTHTDSNGTGGANTGGEQRLSSASNAAVVYRNTGNTDTLPVHAPEGAAATVDGRHTINLSWDHGVTDETTDPDTLYPSSGFRIDYFKGSDTTAEEDAQWKPLWDHTNRTSTKFTHTNLDPGTEVHYRVITYGPNQATSTALGLITETTNGAATSEAPTNLMATREGATMIGLSWQAPENTGGADLEEYEIDMSMMDADGQWGGWASIATPSTTKKVDGSMISYTHDKRSENTRFRYRVRAITDAPAASNTSGWSNTATAQTALAGKADMPIGLVAETALDSNATQPGERGVLLMWNEPEGPAGAVTTHYLIERKVEGEDNDYRSFADTSDVADSDDPLRTDITDFDEPDLAAGEVRYYRVAAVSGSGTGEWAEVRFPVDRVHNFAPTAVGTIAAQTVTAGQSVTVDVVANFSDADMDTLTYRAMSDPTSHATVSVSGSMVTITGVSAGMATITVTATDTAGDYDMQTFMVTVEAADTTPTAPSGVMAEVVTDDRPEGTVYNVKVTWTEGANAEAHGVILFNSDFSLTEHIVRGTGGTHTFGNVAAGSYIAVVVVLDAQGGLVTDANGDYLYAGAESTVMVQP